MSIAEIFDGYDPDSIVRDSDIPERLLEDLGLDQEDEETE